MTLFLNRVEVLSGDITRLKTDAIVNAANGTLMGGGGVDGAIHRAAGPALLEECRQIRQTIWPEGLPTGEAVITRAGHLPCRYVIHTVGPVWHGGKSDEETLLKNAYRNSLDLARDKGLQSVAFPAISTGVYGYPSDLAAKTVYSVLREYIQAYASPEKILLIFFSESGRQTFLRNIPREDVS